LGTDPVRGGHPGGARGVGRPVGRHRAVAGADAGVPHRSRLGALLLVAQRQLVRHRRPLQLGKPAQVGHARILARQLRARLPGGGCGAEQSTTLPVAVTTAAAAVAAAAAIATSPRAAAPAAERTLRRAGSSAWKDHAHRRNRGAVVLQRAVLVDGASRRAGKGIVRIALRRPRPPSDAGQLVRARLLRVVRALHVPAEGWRVQVH